ncbi:hypothetical tolA protein [Photobacterium sp. SKA34]|uniref:cell envelope integrity protein TolA n=1 Tax=Photobacterium sp. SKA34 TaxID=121723 RepID=UPI00006B5803|nr:cell envelope integrity protein TolA [Photobacterium sp. SKA34]EAR54103.1 hypothetical tolA protein [Photobacterium sp. SKA34]
MKNNNYTGSTVISLFIHALLIGLLLWGADFTKKKADVGGNTIQAVVVDPAMIHQQATQIRDQREAAKRAEQESKKKLEDQAEAAEKQRKDEAERARQLKADQLKAEKEAREAEKQRKLVAEQQKQAAEEKRKADEAAKVEAERKAKQEAAEKAEQVRQQKLEEQRKAEEASRQAELERQKQVAAKKKAQEEAAAKAEAKRKEAEAKKKAEAKRKAAEAKKKAEAEAKRKAAEAKKLDQQKEAALNDMFAGLEAENEQRGGAKGQHIADEVARYGAIYKQMIQQNLLVDQSFKGQECNLTMRLSADGLVLDVTQSRGDGALCRAAKSAVVKVSQFPMPDDPEIAKKLRNIKLSVTPQ